MSSSFPDRRTRFTREIAVRHLSGVVLCALLLFFCTNARLAHYDFSQSVVRTASTQSYVDGQETRNKLFPTKLLLSFVAVASVLLLPQIAATPLPSADWIPVPFEVFSPESSPRSPPAR